MSQHTIVIQLDTHEQTIKIADLSEDETKTTEETLGIIAQILIVESGSWIVVKREEREYE